MDYNKIGQFIAQQRKQQKLTQVKLAEQLFVSEKTISKWENGNGLPDTEVLPKLCKVLNISVNELLNGEKITAENYEDKAESNLLKLRVQNEEINKFVLKLEVAFGIISIISLFVMIFFAWFIAEKFNVIVLPIIMIVIAVLICLISVYFCLRIEQKVGYYSCKKCGHKYIPSFTQVNIAMHVGRIRYMKCPKCEQRSWQKKVVK